MNAKQISEGAASPQIEAAAAHIEQSIVFECITYQLSDAIPLKDLEKIALLEEAAVELERKAEHMLFEAQVKRNRAEAIRDRYQTLVNEHGIEACVRKAEKLDGADWQRPSGVA